MLDERGQDLRSEQMAELVADAGNTVSRYCKWSLPWIVISLIHHVPLFFSTLKEMILMFHVYCNTEKYIKGFNLYQLQIPFRFSSSSPPKPGHCGFNLERRQFCEMVSRDLLDVMLTSKISSETHLSNCQHEAALPFKHADYLQPANNLVVKL